MQGRQRRGTLAHELKHVWQLGHGKFKGSHPPEPTPAENQKLELDANKAAVQVTCDAESRLLLQRTRDKDYTVTNGITLDQYYAGQDPKSAQPLPQTSNAQLEYMKEHPPKGCKLPKPGTP